MAIKISNTEVIDNSRNVVNVGTVDGVDISTNIPASLGTAGQVLTVNSGASAGEWADAGGGADLYAENPSSATTPVASGTNAVSIGSNSTATGTNSFAIGLADGDATGDYSFAVGGQATNSNAISIANGSRAQGMNSVSIGNGSRAQGTRAVALGSEAQALTNANAIAIGTSLASGASSFAAAIDNNTTSYGALGTDSIAMGNLNKSTGVSSSSFGGYNNISSGNSSFATGYQCQATADFSLAIGNNAKSDIYGKLAHASGKFGYFGVAGGAQSGTFVLRSDTTDATAEALTTTLSTAGTTNQIVLPNNSCYGFTGTVIAREDSSATNDFAIWEIKGGAVRAGSASTTALGTYNINKISESTGATNWSIALSADTTNGAVAITVTGEASHNIRWVATVNTTEVTY